MLHKLARTGQKLRCACRTSPNAEILPALALSNPTTHAFGRCTCFKQQVCSIHGSAAALANPDNKPAPSGKDPKDPRNVGEDGPSKDPDDSPEWAPGYYDGKGGGHRRVASQEESDQVPDRYPGDDPHAQHSAFEDDDPNLPKEEPHKPDVPDFEPNKGGFLNKGQTNADSDTALNSQDPERVSTGGMPDQETKLAGMPEASAPPQEPATDAAPPEQQAGSHNFTSPFGNPVSDDHILEKTGQKLYDEGRVKPGKPY